jgi:tRNA(Ile)-lysidine synthase
MQGEGASRFAGLVRRNLERLGGTGRGVLAVSGGADSVALLHALADNPPAGELVIAHLNHQLRGNDADADAAFVASLYPSLPHRIETLDVRQLAEGENLEAIARRERYAFLERVARESGANWVATAHTLDDQSETVLHRLIRGTGIRGLRGIAEKRRLGGGIALLRPLLTVCRAEVIGYLQSVDQPWREDATNRDVAFTRNRIRHELLPLLRTFNPGIASVLGRFAEQAEEFFGHLEQEVAADLEVAELPRAGKVVVLNPPSLPAIPEHRLHEMLIAIWEREGWPRGDMTREHWQRAADVARGKAKARDLPGSLRIASTPRVIRIGPAGEVSVG